MEGPGGVGFSVQKTDCLLSFMDQLSPSYNSEPPALMNTKLPPLCSQHGLLLIASPFCSN